MLSPQEEMDIIKGAIAKGYKGPVYELIEQAIIEKQSQASKKPQQNTETPTPALGGKMPGDAPTSSTERNIIKPGQYEHGGPKSEHKKNETDFSTIMGSATYTDTEAANPNPNSSTYKFKGPPLIINNSKVDKENQVRENYFGGYNNYVAKTDNTYVSPSLQSLNIEVEEPQITQTNGTIRADNRYGAGNNPNSQWILGSMPGVTRGSSYANDAVTYHTNIMGSVAPIPILESVKLGGSIGRIPGLIDDAIIPTVKAAYTTTKNVTKSVSNAVKSVSKSSDEVVDASTTALGKKAEKEVAEFSDINYNTAENTRRLDELGEQGSNIRRNRDQNVRINNKPYIAVGGRQPNVNINGESGPIASMNFSGAGGGTTRYVLDDGLPKYANGMPEGTVRSQLGVNYKEIFPWEPVPRYSRAYLDNITSTNRFKSSKELLDEVKGTLYHEQDHTTFMPIQGNSKLGTKPSSRGNFDLNIFGNKNQLGVITQEGIADASTLGYRGKWNSSIGMFDETSATVGDKLKTTFGFGDDAAKHQRLARLKNSKLEGYDNYLEYYVQPHEMSAKMNQLRITNNYNIADYGNLKGKQLSSVYNDLKYQDFDFYSTFKNKEAFQNMFNALPYAAVTPIAIGSVNSNATKTPEERTHKKGGVRKYNKGGKKEETEDKGKFKFTMSKEGNINCGPGTGRGCGSDEAHLKLKPSAGFTYDSNNNMGITSSLNADIYFGATDQRQFTAPTLTLGATGEANAKLTNDNPNIKPNYSLTGTAKLGMKQRNRDMHADWMSVDKGHEYGLYGNYDLQNNNFKDVGVFGSYGVFEGNLGYDLTEKMVKAGVGIKLGKRKKGGFKVKKCKYGC
tara:strand:+ start:799 stop:3342 length:2544 start_codon:yes stop_codon:yes gene_type:complete